MKKLCFKSLALVLTFALFLTGCGTINGGVNSSPTNSETVENAPEFDNKTAYIAINGNIPEFKESELKASSFEDYSPLDELGRCGVATACIGRDIMPTEEREGIGMIKPSGWHTVKYDIVDGKYLYNRCHLIGFQLTGENANERNLITGTRYMNIEGMLPFENMVADYIYETNNHVMYRVTPVFSGYELVARGVKMEALSVEDNGEGICFNVYAYNAQPGIVIDYLSGESKLTDELGDMPIASQESSSVAEPLEYVLNTNSKKIHLKSCGSAAKIKAENKQVTKKSLARLKAEGYTACGSCKP